MVRREVHCQHFFWWLCFHCSCSTEGELCNITTTVWVPGAGGEEIWSWDLCLLSYSSRICHASLMDNFANFAFYTLLCSMTWGMRNEEYVYNVLTFLNDWLVDWMAKHQQIGMTRKAGRCQMLNCRNILNGKNENENISVYYAHLLFWVFRGG